ncbi:MAG: cytochrome c maturation protein CcmE [Ignavibacteriales bacterium]|nr:cytochrome c maturation protein CcmE [Ignavibacteriales bacterium]
MKNVQKLLLPLLVVVVIGIVYLFYFSPHKGLGAFSSFDPNSHAQKEIVVKVVSARGIQQDASGHMVVFFAEDEAGVVMSVQTEGPLPDGFDKAEMVTLTGHIHGGVFSATKVEVD